MPKLLKVLIYILVFLAGVLLGTYLGFKYKPIKKVVEVKEVKAVEIIDYDQNIEERITKICQENGVNPKVCLAVAKCESQLNPFATNLKDFGLYQFNFQRFKNGQIDLKTAINPELATKKFCEIVKKEGLKPWDNTRSCWEKEIITEETEQK
jgi:hypothetical protein